MLGGKPDEESDLDLLIVIDAYTKSKFETMKEGHRALIGLGIYKDILVYDKEEFAQCIIDTTSFCNKIVKNGKVLYAKA